MSRNVRVEEWLARWRVWSLRLASLALIAVARPCLWSIGVGLVLIVLGLLVRIWAAGTLCKRQDLATRGAYACCRHPFYFGSLWVAMGLVALSGRWWTILPVLVLFALVHGAAMREEECFLESRFGERYHLYRAVTPRFWPRLPPPKAWRGAFTWRQVWHNREYNTWLALLLTLGLFAVRYRIWYAVGS